MKQISYLFQVLFFMVLLLATSCNDNQPQKKISEETKKDSSPSVEPVVETKRGPVININDTLSLKLIVLTMKDSAAVMERIKIKLDEIYGRKLGAILKKNNIKITGAAMAWYKGEKAPYFFEAGFPVDKRPAKMPAGVHVKEIGIDSIVVAHFHGPYDLIPQAYDALRDWLKNHKKTAKGALYVIYVDDPMGKDGKLKDPYKVQTDIVFPWK